MILTILTRLHEINQKCCLKISLTNLLFNHLDCAINKRFIQFFFLYILKRKFNH